MKKPENIIVWREILRKYNPTLIGECEKAIKWSETMVSEWLKNNMLANDKNKDSKVSNIISFLGSHNATLSHSRHIHMKELQDVGLVIEEMERDQELQDKILSVHHATIISITQTQSTKIIENNLGKAFIQSA